MTMTARPTESPHRLHAEEMLVSMGPHHPSTHGVLRLILTLDGEVVVSCRPDVGYLHRGIEKIAESLTYAQFMPYTDRVDYVCAMNSNLAWAVAVEKLAGIVVPRRAEIIRVIVAELNRVSSHMVGLGAWTMDLGAFTPFLYGIVYREEVNDLFESLCGARLTYNYLTIGGVAQDAPPGFIPRARRFTAVMREKWHEFQDLITKNTIFRRRLCQVGVVPPETAINFGLVGPNLRASGVRFDLRWDEPYSLYPEIIAKLGLLPPVGDGGDRSGDNPEGALGDAYDRFLVRVKEVYQSLDMVEAALDLLAENDALEAPAEAQKKAKKGQPARHPDQEIQAKVPKVLKLPPGEVYVRTENPRGETGYYLVSDGKATPLRVKIRTGSFSAISIFDHLCRGLMVADVVAIIASLDIVLPEVDR